MTNAISYETVLRFLETSLNFLVTRFNTHQLWIVSQTELWSWQGWLDPTFSLTHLRRQREYSLVSGKSKSYCRKQQWFVWFSARRLYGRFNKHSGESGKRRADYWRLLCRGGIGSRKRIELALVSPDIHRVWMKITSQRGLSDMS